MSSRSILLLTLLAALPMAGQAPPGRVSIAVNQGDLKDILRAATAHTDLNLLFEPGLDTQVHGLNLKAMTLEELLDQTLPALGLTCTRRGRNLHIRKGDGGLRFYHVEQLAMARGGAKTFQVNASGQVLQTASSSGSSTGNGSAYTSNLQMGSTSDPWADLESGLALLVFGRAVERQSAGVQGATPPGSRAYAGDGKTLLIQPHAGLVAVGADPGTQGRVAAYLQEVRQRTQRQVLLEARIVEVALGNDTQMGLDWTALLTPSGTLSTSFHPGATGNSQVDPGQGLFRLVAQGARVQAALSALARDNRLKVLSAPRLAALNNQKAILRVVREEAYALANSQITPGTSAGGAVATSQLTPMIVPVGIVLDIQPQIGDDGVITLAVNPSISEVAQERTFNLPGQGGAAQTPTRLPVVDRRDLDTVVRIRSGETLVLAGIIRSKEGTDHRGVPWLRNLPLLGGLFSKQETTRSRTELAIFISPTLMDAPEPIEAQRRSAERSLEDAARTEPALRTP